ncbi:hypothetical protein IWC73_004260 [Escherichia coli]|nr:hypothetical protein [Escherichia coli]
MATKINCNIHWNINKAEPLMPVSVSLEHMKRLLILMKLFMKLKASTETILITKPIPLLAISHI